MRARVSPHGHFWRRSVRAANVCLCDIVHCALRTRLDAGACNKQHVCMCAVCAHTAAPYDDAPRRTSTARQPPCGAGHLCWTWNVRAVCVCVSRVCVLCWCVRVCRLIYFNIFGVIKSEKDRSLNNPITCACLKPPETRRRQHIAQQPRRTKNATRTRCAFKRSAPQVVVETNAHACRVGMAKCHCINNNDGILWAIAQWAQLNFWVFGLTSLVCFFFWLRHNSGLNCWRVFAYASSHFCFKTHIFNSACLCA